MPAPTTTIRKTCGGVVILGQDVGTFGLILSNLSSQLLAPVFSGSFPTGLTIQNASGFFFLTGIPTALGSYRMTITFGPPSVPDPVIGFIIEVWDCVFTVVGETITLLPAQPVEAGGSSGPPAPPINLPVSTAGGGLAGIVPVSLGGSGTGGTSGGTSGGNAGVTVKYGDILLMALSFDGSPDKIAFGLKEKGRPDSLPVFAVEVDATDPAGFVSPVFIAIKFVGRRLLRSLGLIPDAPGVTYDGEFRLSLPGLGIRSSATLAAAVLRAVLTDLSDPAIQDGQDIPFGEDLI